jgi:hypothetical protein
MDQVNQQAATSYVWEAIWLGNKMLTKNWSKLRDDISSFCQMILKKVALPLGVDGKLYWEAMLLGITNDKFCSLRANFKHYCLSSFKVGYSICKSWKVNY